MSNEWPLVSIDEIKAPLENALSTGPFGSSISSRFFKDSGVPVIRGGNLSENIRIRLSDDGLVFLDQEKANEFKRCSVHEGDLIFTCWGTIGQVGLIDKRSKYSEYIISNKQMKLTPDTKIADSLFLYYVFSGPEFSDAAKSQSIGSSVPGFNFGQLKSLCFRLPPLQIQRRIAHVLGTLDDRIELNRRMNATLKAMARALFRSWFVDFDPVRAKVEGRQPAGMDEATAALFPDEFEESELGEIPKGWSIGSLEQIAVNPRRGVLPGGFPSDTPYIGLEHMPRRSIGIGDWGSAIDVQSNKFSFKQGECLFGKLRPYFHKVCIAPVDSVCSTDILVITHQTKVWSSFILMLVSSDEFVDFTTSASTGTKMPRTSWEIMTRYPVVLPPENIASTFEAMTQAALNQIVRNIHESRTLAALRDAFLPRILSGELPVNATATSAGDA